MKCPYCGYEDIKVLDSRTLDDTNCIRRRRECSQCQRRFTTYERIETVPLIVVKKNGSRHSFDRNKLLNGIIRACEKRPVSLETMEGAVDSIEAQLTNSITGEVTSVEIGELVMEKLKEIDDVAYVRFASVYRQFKDINTFMDELKSLIKEEKGKNRKGKL